MRHISGCIGNLASTPKLREGENGPYTFATVMVSDRIKTKSGTWTDGPAIAYNVAVKGDERSEEHTSELQSRGHLVCRLLLEKKKKENDITFLQQDTAVRAVTQR